MEPLSPNDPVFKLLGKAKPVEPRLNFTQNVVRAIRQEPQRESAWERLKFWLLGPTAPRVAWAGTGTFAAALVAALLLWPQTSPDNGTWRETSLAALAASQSTPADLPQSQRVEAASAEEVAEESSSVASQFESMDQLSLLLAQQDTSALTDNEIAMLLY